MISTIPIVIPIAHHNKDQCIIIDADFLIFKYHNLFSEYKHQYPINFHSRIKTYATSYSRKDMYYMYSLHNFPLKIRKPNICKMGAYKNV